jgi:O-antigen ligase
MSLSQNDLYKFLIFIFFLLPFFLISGSFLSDVFAIIISCVSFFFLFKEKISIIDKKYKIIFFFLLFYLYININSLFSINPSISFQSSIPYLRMIFFALGVCFCLNVIPNLKKIIFISFCISYLVLLIDSIFQLKTGHSILGYTQNINRISSFFGRKLIMGSFVARTLPFVLAITFIENFNNKKIIQSFVLVISGVLIFLSAERLAFAYYIIITFLFILLTINKKNLFIYLILIFTTSSLLYFIKPSSWQRLAEHSIAQFREASSPLGISYRHQLHYNTAYDLFLDKKFIGHGLKSFRELCDKEKYNQRDKIVRDNKIFSPINGIFFFDKINIYVIPEDIFNSINSSIDDYSKLSPRIFKYENYNSSGGMHLDNKQKGDFVLKGDLLGSYYPYLNGCNTHPHNINLEFLSELGLIGYFFLLSFFIYIFFKIINLLIKIYKNSSKKILRTKKEYYFYCLFILIGLFNSLFPFFPSGSFFNNWLSVIFYLNLGFFINSNEKLLK